MRTTALRRGGMRGAVEGKKRGDEDGRGRGEGRGPGRTAVQLGHWCSIPEEASRRPRAAPRSARPAAVASSSSASASRTSRGAPLDPGTPARASASSSSRAPGGASQPAASPAAACAASPACATPAPAAQASDTMTPRTEAVVEQVLALGHAPRHVGGEDKLRSALQRKREEGKTSTDAEAQLQALPQGHRSDCDK